jgi:hypothetical protein
VHPDLLTVAIRGHFAARMRALSESHGMSLSKLLRDAVLVYEAHASEDYDAGTSLRGRTSVTQLWSSGLMPSCYDRIVHPQWAMPEGGVCDLAAMCPLRPRVPN